MIMVYGCVTLDVINFFLVEGMENPTICSTHTGAPISGLS